VPILGHRRRVQGRYAELGMKPFDKIDKIHPIIQVSTRKCRFEPDNKAAGPSPVDAFSNSRVGSTSVSPNPGGIVNALWPVETDGKLDLHLLADVQEVLRKRQSVGDQRIARNAEQLSLIDQPAERFPCLPDRRMVHGRLATHELDTLYIVESIRKELHIPFRIVIFEQRSGR
jgi:hypothetical protein